MVDGKRLLERLTANTTTDPERADWRHLSFELEYAAPVDVLAEIRRTRKLLGTDNVILETIHPELPEFLVLRFSDIRPTLSPNGKFAIASELVDLLGLRAAIPEGSRSFPLDELLPKPEAPEGRVGGAILDLTCWSKIDQSLDSGWVAKYLSLDDVWGSTRGEGITIAQPDTGVTPHPEIEGALDLDRSLDVLSGSTGTADDPLSPEMGNPGHGTATSSVIASDHRGSILGVAPGASLVPIRCIDSVILKIDGSSVAQAIMYASSIDADVISLSLGGPFVYRSVQKAIEIAVSKGAIVVAASGNCVGIVVYPASDPLTIAVAGVGAGDEPWKGTSRGDEVDVAAPSENVFAARRRPDDGGAGMVAPSQGTSYGTALTAGVAALWLSHFGRDVVRSRAKALDTTVNDLFRRALHLTARAPAGNSRQVGMGAGIVNARTLLNLPLERIDMSTRFANATKLSNEFVAQASIDYRTVSELAIEGSDIDGFDWRRHGPEALFLARENLASSDLGVSELGESSAKPTLSDALHRSTKPEALNRILERLNRLPQTDVKGLAPASRLNDIFLGLGGVRQGGLETTIADESRRADVENRLRLWSREGGLEQLESADRLVIEKLDKFDGDNADVRRQAIEDGTRAIRDIRDGRDPESISIEGRIGLESLVRLTGRPAFRLEGGRISPDDPLFGDGGWGNLFAHWDRLAQVTAAVGRINLNALHVGTGFLFSTSPNLIMTNRHVLESIAEEIQSSRGSEWVFSENDPRIDFSESGSGGQSYPIRQVVFAGDRAIEGRVNLSVLDLVVLEIDGDAKTLPSPLELSHDDNRITERSEMFTVGYPARPGPDALVDPSGGKSSSQIATRLGQIFGIAYGRKYLSPGEVMRGTGQVRGDLRDWAFSHDATTLGGSSGSMVIALGGEPKVIGIHFAGRVMTHNLAHHIARTGVIESIR